MNVGEFRRTLDIIEEETPDIEIAVIDLHLLDSRLVDHLRLVFEVAEDGMAPPRIDIITNTESEE